MHHSRSREHCSHRERRKYPEHDFDLSLSVDLHRHSVAQTHERPVAGVTSGVMKLGDTVTWEAIHFGMKQHLTSKITAYERPYRFTDEMMQGVFQEITHRHAFVPQASGTFMIDLFAFRAPLGILGKLAERLVLTRYMKGLLLSRNRYLKQVAEAGTDAALLSLARPRAAHQAVMFPGALGKEEGGKWNREERRVGVHPGGGLESATADGASHAAGRRSDQRLV